MHHRDARHGDGAGKTVWPMEVKENIEVLICTVDEGIRRVPDVLSPTVRGDVRYLVSFQYTDKNRKKLEEFKDQKSMVAYLKTQNLVEKFVRFAETRGIKRRNLLIHKSYKLLESLIYGSIVNYALDINDYIEYLNETDPTVLKAVDVLEKGEAFPKAPEADKKGK